ncbi:MAG: LmeA family phospholipid-binding protein [Acidimicrobiales bacterium]|nr:LmeA family phospholipid-binding protein [Acidimicrobiales bacterium]
MDDPGDAGTGGDPGALWGLVDDPDVVRAAAEAADASRAGEPPLAASLLALLDATSARLLDHPIRPRVKATPGGLLKGELDVVKIEVPAVLAAGLVLDRLVIRAEHVRIVPGLRPRLQARPVGLRAYVSQANVDRWTRTSRLPIRVDLTEEGVMLTTQVRGIRMGQVLADLEVAGSFLRLAPKQMTIAGLPTPLVRFLRGYLPLPPLPRGARITEVRPGNGELAVTFEIEALDEGITPDIARRLATLTRLPIPGLR